MECPRGSKCTDSVHEVTTIKKAVEWWPDAHEDDLPIKIHQYTASNGRLTYKIFANNGDQVFSKG